MYYYVWKSPFKIRFHKKMNISSSGARTHELRAEIENFFVRFLVQIKSAKSPFEINWPLGRMKYTIQCSAVDSGGAGGAWAPPEFDGSEKRTERKTIYYYKHPWIWKDIYMRRHEI